VQSVENILAKPSLSAQFALGSNQTGSHAENGIRCGMKDEGRHFR
jgi:hypothetical protein